MRLLSMVSKGNRIAKVRTYGAAGYMIELIELTELKTEAGKILKRVCARLYNKFNTSIRKAENWAQAEN